MTNQNRQEANRSLLASKTRDEINIIAQRLHLRKYRKMQKSELIDRLLQIDAKALNELLRLRPSWWQRYHDHIYGGASILGLILGIIFFAFPYLQDAFSVGSNRSLPASSIQHEKNNTSGVIPRLAPSPFQMNKDYQRRDALLGIAPDWQKEPGGVSPLEHINLKTLELLFSEKFIDPEDRLNNHAPSAKKFLAFMQSHPNVLAHGYAVSPIRKDYRITVEGLRVYPSYVTQELKIAFFEFCKDADEIDTENGLWCWWD